MAISLAQSPAMPVGSGSTRSGWIPLASTIAIPVIDFTIRRLLVGEPPYEQIELKAGHVNRSTWPADKNFRLPQFQPETLKFESADITNRYSARGDKHRWYEITYHFTWLNYWSYPVYKANGVPYEKYHPITWNHVLFRPRTKVPFAAFNSAWYYVRKRKTIETLGLEFNIFTIDEGPLYGSVHFDDLFKLNPK